MGGSSMPLMETGIKTYTIPGIYASASIKQLLDDVEMSKPRRKGERCPAVGIGGTCVRARAQQQPNRRRAPALAREHERGCPILYRNK